MGKPRKIILVLIAFIIITSVFIEIPQLASGIMNIIVGIVLLFLSKEEFKKQ